MKGGKEIVEDGLYELEKGLIIVNGKYKVIAKIGTGHRASVHSIVTEKGQKQITRAIKVESSHVKQPQLRTEVSVLRSIKASNPEETGFAQLYEFSEEPEYNYMVTTLLGPNLDQLLKLCNATFSLKTTMVIALQLLDRLEVLHESGYVHGDLSPENCLMGLNGDSPFVFLTDFGRSKKYRNKATGQHIAYKQNVQYSFNSAFASINAHNSVQASRRDDLESLFYMVNYLKFGKLPWFKPNDPKRKDYNVEEIKKRLTPEILCHKMPFQIVDLMYYIRSIEFYQKPDYDFVRRMFFRVLEREEFDNCLLYDWNKLEDVDFKVYNGEPKIVLKGSAAATTVYENAEQNLAESQISESRQVVVEEQRDQSPSIQTQE